MSIEWDKPLSRREVIAAGARLAVTCNLVGATGLLYERSRPPAKSENGKLIITQAKTEQSPIPRRETLPPSPLEQYILEHIDKIPRLKKTAAQFPDDFHFQNVEAQLAHIEHLKKIDVTPEYYNDFLTRLDKSRIGAFDKLDYHHPITPVLYVVHLTECGVRDVDSLILSQLNKVDPQGKPNRTSFAFFTDKRGNTHQLSDFLHREGHALGIDPFGVAINAESNGSENEGFLVTDITDKMYMEEVCKGVYWARSQKREISRGNVVGHMAVDLLFNNKGYDKNTGKAEAYRKFDPPEDFMPVLVEAMQQLDLKLVA